MYNGGSGPSWQPRFRKSSLGNEVHYQKYHHSPPAHYFPKKSVYRSPPFPHGGDDFDQGHEHVNHVRIPYGKDISHAISFGKGYIPYDKIKGSFSLGRERWEYFYYFYLEITFDFCKIWKNKGICVRFWIFLLLVKVLYKKIKLRYFNFLSKILFSSNTNLWLIMIVNISRILSFEVFKCLVRSYFISLLIILFNRIKMRWKINL